MRPLQGWLLALGVITGAASATAAQDSPHPVTELPADAREALTKTWEDWSLASKVDATCAVEGGSGARLMTTDLDNDGREDFVAVVQTAAGQRLAAVVYRLTGYEIFDLDPFGTSAGAIVLERRGVRFTPASGSDDFFPASTIVVRGCDGTTTGYLWTGVGFRRTAITR